MPARTSRTVVKKTKKRVHKSRKNVIQPQEQHQPQLQQRLSSKDYAVEQVDNVRVRLEEIDTDENRTEENTMNVNEREETLTVVKPNEDKQLDGKNTVDSATFEVAVNKTESQESQTIDLEIESTHESRELSTRQQEIDLLEPGNNERTKTDLEDDCLAMQV